jgi:TRAP-type mannitol/chloroaromatic compound transport system permease small subunit
MNRKRIQFFVSCFFVLWLFDCLFVGKFGDRAKAWYAVGPIEFSPTVGLGIGIFIITLVIVCGFVLIRLPKK